MSFGEGLTESFENNPENFESSSAVVRKTLRSSVEDLTSADFIKGKEKLNRNVLNNYRSYTYNFTLFCPRKSELANSNITNLEDLSISNIIAKSGGKGPNSRLFTEGVQNFDEFNPKDDAEITQISRLIEQEINDFNQFSGGRFDLYIDDVNITVLPVGYQTTQNTPVSHISFKIIEPYSVVGFMEALRNASLASGYRGIINGSTIYCLKMQFVGYPDTPGIPAPEIVPKSTRFFFFRFSTIDNKIGLEGTEYTCTGISADAEAASLIAQSRSAVQVSGSTVYDVLDAAAKQFTENAKNELKRRFGENYTPESGSDEWEVLWVDEEGKEIKDPKINSAIAKSKVSDKATQNTIYSFEKPETTTVRNSYDPLKEAIASSLTAETSSLTAELGNPTLVFRKNTNFHDIINAVIRDSEYLPNLLQKNTDDPTIPFWFVWLKTEDLLYSNENKTFFKKFTYIIREKKIIKTSLPGFESNLVSYDKIKYLISREYEYIYTGKNVDIVNFEINLNAMFYSYGAAGDGNIVSVSNRDVLANNNDTKPQESLEEVKILSKKYEEKLNESPTRILPVSQGRRLAVNAGPPKDDPWYILARNAYEHLLTTYVGDKAVNVSLDIVGDPFYLITENFSGFISQGTGPETEGGEADILNGVYVTLRFRNPIDYDPVTGKMSFDNNNRTMVWNGVYQVTQMENTFREGEFKTKLTLIKQPGVILEEDSSEEITITSPYKSVPKPENQRVENIGEEKAAGTCKSGVLKELVSGVNRIADSVQQAEARITGAIQGAATGLSNALNEVAQVPADAISKVTNKINGAVQGINSAVTDAGNKLGISPSQLSSLSPRELIAMVAVAKIVPDKFSISNLENKGVCLTNSDDVKNLPPSGQA